MWYLQHNELCNAVVLIYIPIATIVSSPGLSICFYPFSVPKRVRPHVRPVPTGQGSRRSLE
jgi:hypothetical protein